MDRVDVDASEDTMVAWHGLGSRVSGLAYWFLRLRVYFLTRVWGLDAEGCFRRLGVETLKPLKPSGLDQMGFGS